METLPEESEDQQTAAAAGASSASTSRAASSKASASNSRRSSRKQLGVEEEGEEETLKAEDGEEVSDGDREKAEKQETAVKPAAVTAASADEAAEDEGPARLFRSGKGPAEQAYELYLKELAEWKEAKAEQDALKRQQEKDQRGRAKQLASLDLDSSGSETDLEDVDDPARESWAGLTRGLEKLYERACATYEVTALSQFKFQLDKKHLSITSMSLRHRDVAAMCIPLQHKDDLTYINLSGNLIGSRGLQSLLNVTKEFRQLNTLDLSNNSLGSEAAQVLVSAVDGLRNLRTLNLAGNGFLERDAEWIASLITQLENLRTLNASSNTFGSHGGEFFGAALRDNGSLENLSLACCEIRMHGAVRIGLALKDNGSLDSLDVSSNGFARLGAEAMAEGLRANSALTVLNLSANRICNEGAQALSNMLAVNETLKELYLDKNSITCEGAQEILAKLKGNENTALKVLDMKNVSVTYKTAAAVLPTMQQPLLVRLESFVREPARLREQLYIPNSSGPTHKPLLQSLQAEAAHVLRVFTSSQRINLVRLAREAGVKGRGAKGGGKSAKEDSGEGLTEGEMRRLLLSLPIGLEDGEVDSLMSSLPGEPGPDGACVYSLNSLMTLGEPQQARLETQH